MDRSGFAYQAKVNAKRDLYVLLIVGGYDGFEFIVKRFVGNAQEMRDMVRVFSRQYSADGYNWRCNPVKGK